MPESREARLRVRLAFAAGILAVSPAPASPGDGVRVGPTVQVSRVASERAHEEVILAAHPTDPRRLLACSIVDRDRYAERLMHAVAYTSDDGGAHWRHAVESNEFNGDPMCGFGPDGHAYFLSIGTDQESWKKVIWWMELFRSEDGGATWGKGVVGRAGDRPYLAFDAGDGPTRGTGYIVYSIRATALDKEGVIATPRDGAAPVLEVLRSEDGWKSWTKAAVGVTLGPSIPTATGAAVLSDGSLATLWIKRFLTKNAAGEDSGQDSHEELNMTLAAPRAELFGRTVKIADVTAGNPHSGTFFSLTADPFRGPYRDRLYAVWADTATPRSRILVSFSSDRGSTWSAPRAINPLDAADAPPSMDDYMPTVAVNRDGVVAVTFRRRTRNDEEADVYFTASSDGGATWSAPVLVSSAGGPVAGGVAKAHLGPKDDGASPASRRQKFFKGGDTSGLAADADGVFHALWADQRSGLGQVFTATIAVEKSTRRGGSK